MGADVIRDYIIRAVVVLVSALLGAAATLAVVLSERAPEQGSVPVTTTTTQPYMRGPN